MGLVYTLAEVYIHSIINYLLTPFHMKSSMKANPQQKYGVSVCHQMLCRSCLSLLLQLQMPGKMQYIMCNIDTLITASNI